MRFEQKSKMSPRYIGPYDIIWTIVEKLTKLEHFLPIRWISLLYHLAEKYAKDAARFYGILSFMSSRSPQFTIYGDMIIF